MFNSAVENGQLKQSQSEQQKRLNQCQTVGREGEEKGMVEIQTYGKGVKEREREW